MEPALEELRFYPDENYSKLYDALIACLRVNVHPGNDGPATVALRADDPETIEGAAQPCISSVYKRKTWRTRKEQRSARAWSLDDSDTVPDPLIQPLDLSLTSKDVRRGGFGSSMVQGEDVPGNGLNALLQAAQGNNTDLPAGTVEAQQTRESLSDEYKELKELQGPLWLALPVLERAVRVDTDFCRKLDGYREGTSTGQLVVMELMHSLYDELGPTLHVPSLEAMVALHRRRILKMVQPALHAMDLVLPGLLQDCERLTEQLKAVFVDSFDRVLDSGAVVVRVYYNAMVQLAITKREWYKETVRRLREEQEAALEAALALPSGATLFTNGRILISDFVRPPPHALGDVGHAAMDGSADVGYRRSSDGGGAWQAQAEGHAAVLGDSCDAACTPGDASAAAPAQQLHQRRQRQQRHRPPEDVAALLASVRSNALKQVLRHLQALVKQTEEEAAKVGVAAVRTGDPAAVQLYRTIADHQLPQRKRWAAKLAELFRQHTATDKDKDSGKDKHKSKDKDKGDGVNGDATRATEAKRSTDGGSGAVGSKVKAMAPRGSTVGH